MNKSGSGISSVIYIYICIDNVFYSLNNRLLQRNSRSFVILEWKTSLKAASCREKWVDHEDNKPFGRLHCPEATW